MGHPGWFINLISMACMLHGYCMLQLHAAAAPSTRQPHRGPVILFSDVHIIVIAPHHSCIHSVRSFSSFIQVIFVDFHTFRTMFWLPSEIGAILQAAL
jgi:hypothetical protein